MTVRRLNLEWVRQGNVRWRDWWVRQHGYTRSHIPGLEEHIGFANFDLAHNGVPGISVGSRGELYIDHDPDSTSTALILAVVREHGFDLKTTT